MQNYELPPHHRTASLGLGICLVILAIASIIVGGCGFIDYNYLSWLGNGSVYTGHDIWIGVFYWITGILAMVAYKGGDRPHLMKTYYAFTIISFILSMAQIGIALGFIIGGYYYPIWQNVVSSVFGFIGFSFTMTCMILLSKGIFCASPSIMGLPAYTPYTQNYGSIANNPQVIPQQVPQPISQPAIVLGNQQPTVFQSLDGRQFYVAVPTTGIVQPQMAMPTNVAIQPRPPNYPIANTNENCKA